MLGSVLLLVMMPVAASNATHGSATSGRNSGVGSVGMIQEINGGFGKGDRRASIEKAALALGATSTWQSRCIAR